MKSEDKREKFIEEAYGVRNEPEIEAMMAALVARHKEKEKIPLDKMEESPRHLGNLFKRANKSFKKVNRDEIVSFELPENLEKSLYRKSNSSGGIYSEIADGWNKIE